MNDKRFRDAHPGFLCRESFLRAKTCKDAEDEKIYDSCTRPEQEKQYNAYLDSLIYSDKKYPEKIPESFVLYQEVFLTQLNTLVADVCDETIKDGELGDYAPAQQALFSIATWLQNFPRQTGEKIANEQIDCLLRLSVSGGAYCGPGKEREIFYALQDVTDSAPADNMPHATITPTYIISLLNRWRQNTFDADFVQFTSSKAKRFFSSICDTKGIHFYNLIVLLIGPKYGIDNQRAYNDTAALHYLSDIGPVALFLQWVASKHFKFDLNSVDAIMSSLSTTIGTPEFPIDSFTDWWLSWITNQVPQNEQQPLLDELTDKGSLFGFPLTQTIGSQQVVNPILLKAMLLQMNILI